MVKIMKKTFRAGTGIWLANSSQSDSNKVGLI